MKLLNLLLIVAIYFLNSCSDGQNENNKETEIDNISSKEQELILKQQELEAKEQELITREKESNNAPNCDNYIGTWINENYGKIIIRKIESYYTCQFINEEINTKDAECLNGQLSVNMGFGNKYFKLIENGNALLTGGDIYRRN